MIHDSNFRFNSQIFFQKLKNHESYIKRTKKIFDPILWMGFNCLKATEPLREDVCKKVIYTDIKNYHFAYSLKYVDLLNFFSGSLKISKMKFFAIIVNS